MSCASVPMHDAGTCPASGSSIELQSFAAPEDASLSGCIQRHPDPSYISCASKLTKNEDDLPPSCPSPIHITEAPATDVVAVIPEAAQNKVQQRRLTIHLSALFFCYFLLGWNDGSTGPLLPTIQRYYGVNTTIVSMLFVTSCVGFLAGAVSTVYLSDRIGFGKVVILGAVTQLCGYAIDSPGGPFPLLCAGYAFAGFGTSLQMAQANGFVGNLKTHTRLRFGIMHACYGLGAFSAPLVATQFATMPRWSFYYLVSASLSVANICALICVFRFKRQDDIMAEAGLAPADKGSVSDSKYRQIMGMKAVHFLSIWALIYVGAEVSIGGWIVTFVEDKRGGTASSGYISSGFFGGLMVGRLALIWINRKIGEHRVMFLYTLIAIGLEITIWVVPSLIENAVAVSFIGLLLGPMYPILMNHSTTILPAWLLTGSVGYISGLGQAGSAVLPLVTGLLASKFGIGALQPLVVSMMSTMVVLWALVPKTRRID